MNRRLLPAVLVTLWGFLVSGQAQAGQGMVSYTLQYDGWETTNTLLPFNGAEFLLPFSINYAPDPHWNLYAQTAFAAGSYTDSLDGTQTQDLTNLTETALGTQVYFNTFGISSMLEMDLTLPTGDPTWETKQVPSNVPILFINSRYADEGWEAGVLYGLSFPDGKTVKYGAAVGYDYLGPYDPGFPGLPGASFKMGDTFLLALNRTETLKGKKSSLFRLSATVFEPTLENGATDYQLGPCITGSYSFNDPRGFSWGIGANYYAPSDRFNLTPSGTEVYGLEPFVSSAAQFFATPSYTFGNLTLGALVKYILANGYPLWNASGLYNGGGWLFGLDPQYFLSLDNGAALNFNGGIDYIIAHDAAYDSTLGQPVDLKYLFWNLGVTYEFKI